MTIPDEGPAEILNAAKAAKLLGIKPDKKTVFTYSRLHKIPFLVRDGEVMYRKFYLDQHLAKVQGIAAGLVDVGAWL